jgi:hypothetical protein
MPFIYEVNGQKVEFEKEPSEADIDEAARGLGAPPPKAEQDTTIPAVGARVPGTTGLGDLAKTALDIGKSTGTAAIKAAVAGPIASYAANPLKAGAIDAVSTLATGLPLGTAYDTVKSLPAKYQAAKEAAEGANAALSKTPGREWEQALAKGQMPEAPGAFRDLRNIATKLDPAYSAQLRQALDTGNDPAVKKLLASAPDALKNDPAFAAQTEKYLASIPGFGTKAMRVAAPILRGVSKVAAPVGAALEAGQGIQQAAQGDRTGAALSGLSAASMFNPVGMIAQPGLSMMQSANQNFRQQPQYQQRQSVDAALGGTAPGMFGGDFPQQDNEKAIQMAIRVKAAKKVLGQ